MNLCLEICGRFRYTGIREVMDVEDKALLEAIGKMMDQKLSQALEPINTRLDGMQKDLSEVKDRTTKIEVTLENDIKTDLKLLHEGQAGMNEKFAKLDKVAEDVDDIQIKVSAIAHVTQDNTSQINQLRKVN